MSWLKIYYAFIVLEPYTVGMGRKWRRNILRRSSEYIDYVGRKINLIFDVYFTFNLTIILIINLQIINENYSYYLSYNIHDARCFGTGETVTLKLLRFNKFFCCCCWCCWCIVDWKAVCHILPQVFGNKFSFPDK